MWPDVAIYAVYDVIFQSVFGRSVFFSQRAAAV